MRKGKDSFLVAMAVAVLYFLIGLGLGYSYRRNASQEPIVERVDTLVVRDTVRVTEAKEITRTVLDSVLVPVTDTVRMRDTLYIYMEREQVVWTDSLSRIYASGIEPSIDSVFHFTSKVVEMHYVPVKVRSRWGVGVQVGYGIGKDGLSPYVGAGVSYNLLSW